MEPKPPQRPHDKTPKLYFHKTKRRWYIASWDPSGVRTWRVAGLDEDTAKDALAKRVAELTAAKFGLLKLTAPEQERTTVNQCLDLLLDDYVDEKRHSLPSMEIHVRHVRTVLGTARVSALTLGRVKAARRHWLRQGHAESSVNRYIAALRRAIRLAHEHELIPALPRFRWPKFDETEFIREGLVLPEQLAQVNAHEPTPAIRDMNEWAFWTGMRRGEICKLTWKAFHPPTWTLTLPGRHAKNRRPRTFTLPEGPYREIIARRLADRLPDRPDVPWIFHAHGRPIPLKGSNHWTAAWMRAGLPMVQHPRSGNWVPEHIFHDLRRTGLTNLIDAGVNEKLAMEISGHRTRAIFDRYNIQDRRQLTTALTKVAAHVGPLPVLPPAPLSYQARAWQEGRRRVLTPMGRHAHGRRPVAGGRPRPPAPRSAPPAHAGARTGT